MNFKKFINSDYLKNNPLCGIDTYKDKLNLATGACTRKIKKLILNGTENWVLYNGNYYSSVTDIYSLQNTPCRCTHTAGGIIIDNGSVRLKVFASRFTAVASNLEEWKTYLQQQYQNGVPVIVWYFLAEPTTETITVPSGLSGTEEGYLIQDGTPTPTNPIYPTANTVEKWFDSPHYIHNTSTDTITTLPAVLYPNAVTATVGLKGDMEQSSTPSPDNPIMPQGTGERTGNLAPPDWAEDFVRRIGNLGLAKITDGMLDYQVSAGYGDYDNKYLFKTAWKENTRYVISLTYIRPKEHSGAGIMSVEYTDGGATTTFNPVNDGEPHRINLITDAGRTVKYLRARYTKGSAQIRIDDFMVNEGSTPLPYEPYGYKIPISSANTTTPVYLGEVESTRRIKKLVLTGNENITLNGKNNTREILQAYFALPSSGTTEATNIKCSHLDTLASGASTFNTEGIAMRANGTDMIFGFAFANIGVTVTDSTAVALTKLVAYLAAQYSAGTPVTVWYVLATPATGIVNEPLRKIGDYADTVSGITIPTIAGANTLSVGTTLQPSEVTVNYKGWHPIQNVHEAENGQWD